MDENYVRNTLMAFYKGVLEFGLEEAMNRLVTNVPSTEENILIISAAWTGLFSLFLPELMSNKQFIDLLGDCAAKVDKAELENRLKAIIDQY